MIRFLAGILGGFVAYTWGYRDGHGDGYRSGRTAGLAAAVKIIRHPGFRVEWFREPSEPTPK